MSLRDRIREQSRLRRETVAVPEWDCTLTLRELDGLERLRLDRRQDELPEDTPEREKQFLFGVRLLAAAAEGDDGTPLFDAADEEWLARRNPDVLARLIAVAARLSGVTAEAQEELKKNSATTPLNGSHSASACRPEGSTSNVP